MRQTAGADCGECSLGPALLQSEKKNRRESVRSEDGEGEVTRPRCFHPLRSMRAWRRAALHVVAARRIHGTAPAHIDRDTAWELLRKSRCGYSELESLDKGFRKKLAKNKRIGKYDFSLLIQKLGVQEPGLIDRLYVAADKGNGEPRVQEIITSIALLIPEPDQRKLLDLLFVAWDRDGKNALNLEEFRNFYSYVRCSDPNSYSLLVPSEVRHPIQPEPMRAAAEEAFHKTDTNKSGRINKQEFIQALSPGNPLHLDAAFFERIQDPMRCGQLFAPFDVNERTLLKLLGKQHVFFENEELPHTVTGVDGHHDVFYLVLSGSVQLSFENDDIHQPTTVGQFAFINAESVLVSKSFRYRLLKRARALSNVRVLQVPTRDFRLAYMEREAGAQKLMMMLRDRMAESLEVEENSDSANVRRFASIKRNWLHGQDKVLEEKNLRQSLVDMQYAVRGLVPTTAERIQQELSAGSHSKPFDEILWANIGNPHAVGQKPVTFYREVLAAVDCPSMLEKPGIENILPPDVIARAKWLTSKIKGGTGAYSHSQGIEAIRRHVAEFIEKRDGHICRAADIFLTNGASAGIQMMLQALIADKSDTILAPIPQYPIYSALVRLFDGQLVGYYMDEDSGWSLDVAALTTEITEARKRGLNPKALVIINPGNPVGNCLSYSNLVDLVKLCRKERLVLLADEVYQENIYGDRPFVSVKKVLRDLGPEYDSFELVSFHSTSKGLIGECGRRGGYMELCGFDSKVQAQLYKLASSGLCSNLDGQVMVDVMVKPPLPGDESYELFREETTSIYSSLKRKSVMLYTFLNQIDGVSCEPLQGAMYAFPQIHLPPSAIAEALAEGHEPDTFYALSLLEHTGICAVPGSGFGQKEGTYHLRLTFLPEETKLEQAMHKFKQHHEMFMKKFTQDRVMWQ